MGGIMFKEFFRNSWVKVSLCSLLLLHGASSSIEAGPLWQLWQAIQRNRKVQIIGGLTVTTIGLMTMLSWWRNRSGTTQQQQPSETSETSEKEDKENEGTGDPSSSQSSDLNLAALGTSLAQQRDIQRNMLLKRQKELSNNLLNPNKRFIKLPESLKDYSVRQIHGLQQLVGWSCGMFAVWHAWLIDTLLHQKNVDLSSVDQIATNLLTNEKAYSYDAFKHFYTQFIVNGIWKKIKLVPDEISMLPCKQSDMMKGAGNYLDAGDLEALCEQLKLQDQTCILSIRDDGVIQSENVAVLMKAFEMQGNTAKATSIFLQEKKQALQKQFVGAFHCICRTGGTLEPHYILISILKIQDSLQMLLLDSKNNDISPTSQQSKFIKYLHQQFLL